MPPRARSSASATKLRAAADQKVIAEISLSEMVVHLQKLCVCQMPKQTMQMAWMYQVHWQAHAQPPLVKAVSIGFSQDLGGAEPKL